MFFPTFITVAVMLVYAVPGFALVKSKKISESSIPSFAMLLMYLCQPCLTIYSFQKVSYTPRIALDMLLMFGLGMAVMCLMMVLFWALFHKKYDNIGLRVANVAVSFGNSGFMGVPLVEALLPQYAEAAMMSMAFCSAMNILGWTVASALITRDKSYISFKKAFLNPSLLSLAVAIALFFGGVSIPQPFGDAVTLLGRMSTPLCMLIMGMRLATAPVKQIFTDKIPYFAVAVKQIIMPLIAFGLVLFLPIAADVKTTFVILCCCPVASIVLNFAEMLGDGQKTASRMVLLGTLASIITVPFMLLFLVR